QGPIEPLGLPPDLVVGQVVGAPVQGPVELADRFAGVAALVARRDAGDETDREETGAPAVETARAVALGEGVVEQGGVRHLPAEVRAAARAGLRLRAAGEVRAVGAIGGSAALISRLEEGRARVELVIEAVVVGGGAG